MLQLEAQLDDRNVTIEMTDGARDWLARKGFDPAYGARPLSRTIQEHVKKPMAEELLFGKLAKGGAVKIDIDKKDSSKLAFTYIEDKPKPKKSKAKADDDTAEPV